MNIDKLKNILIENKIDETACQVLPSHFVEGALTLKKEDDGSWIVLLNERGEWLIKERFWVLSDACKVFLKQALRDPTYRINFRQSDLATWEKTYKELLQKYDLK